MNKEEKVIQKLDELTTFFTKREWDLESFRSTIDFNLGYQKKNK